MTFAEQLLVAALVFGFLALYSLAAMVNAWSGPRTLPRPLRLVMDPQGSAIAGRRAAAVVWATVAASTILGLLVFAYVAEARAEPGVAFVMTVETLAACLWGWYLVPRRRIRS